MNSLLRRRCTGRRATRTLRSAVAVVVTFAATGILLAFPTTSSAVGTCGTSATTNNRGVATTQNEYQDVWSWIVTKSPQLCTGTAGGGTPFSYAWVMLASNDTNNWAQVGPASWAGVLGRETTFQWTDNGNPQPPVFHPAAALGTAPSYEVAYISSSGKTRMTGNGYIEEISVNPFASWARPINAQVAGETNYCGSNLPGTQASPEEFRDIAGVQYGGSISTLTDAAYFGKGCESQGRYFRQWGTFPTLLQMWTYPT